MDLPTVDIIVSLDIAAVGYEPLLLGIPFLQDFSCEQIGSRKPLLGVSLCQRSLLGSDWDI